MGFSRQIVSLFKKGYNDNIVKSSSLSFLIRLFGFALTFLTTLVISNYLGAEQYGIYIYIFTLANLAVLVVIMGLDTLVLRQSVKYIANRQFALFRGLLTGSILSIAVLSFFIAIGLKSLIKFEILDSDQFYSLENYLIFLIPLLALIRLLQGLARSFHAPVLAQIPDQLIRRIVLLGLCLWSAGILLEQVGSATNALKFQAIASLIAIGCSVYLVFKYWPETDRMFSIKFEWNFWAKASVTLAMTTVLQTVVAQLPIITLSHYSGPESIAKYSIAERTGALLNLFLIAANFSIAGKIAALDINKNLDQMNEIATKAARFSFYLAAPFALLLFVFAEFVVSLYGDEYNQSALLLRIIICGYMIHIATGPSAIFLQMTSHEKYIFNVSLVMFLANIFLSIVLVKYFSHTGAAIAFILSFVIFKLTIFSIVNFKLKINTSIFRIPNQ